jgi:hypothetical protein
MRIHLHNPTNDPLFEFSMPMWQAAAERAGELGAGHVVTVGTTAADFAAAMTGPTVICDAGVIKAYFCRTRLKLLFATMRAGSPGAEPRLPQGVTLMNNRGTHAAKSGEFGIMSLLMLAIASADGHHQREPLAQAVGAVCGAR